MSLESRVYTLRVYTLRVCTLYADDRAVLTKKTAKIGHFSKKSPIFCAKRALVLIALE